MGFFRPDPLQPLCDEVNKYYSYHNYYIPKEIRRLLGEIKEEYREKGIRYSWISDFELIIRDSTANTLEDPYEGYAQEIRSLFSQTMDSDEREMKVRAIGEKMDNNHDQLVVAWRAYYLCEKNARLGVQTCNEFSIRYLERVWEGLGGWRA